MKTLKQLPTGGHAESSYEGAGMTMAREEGLTPNGNELNNKWVLRITNENIIDINNSHFIN